MHNTLITFLSITLMTFIFTACGGDEGKLNPSTTPPEALSEESLNNPTPNHPDDSILFDQTQLDNSLDNPTLNLPDELVMSDIDIKTVPANEIRTYQIELSHYDDVEVSIDNIPTWLDIDDNGMLTLAPSSADIGEYSFKLTASKEGFTTQSQTFNFEVKEINTDLAAQFSSAPLVPVEAILEPIQTTSFNHLHKVQNPNGSWDILAVYMKEYGGPNEIVIIDTDSGQIKHVNQTDYMQWHAAPSVTAPNGKLYILTIVRPGLSKALNIYDPVNNTLELNAITLPLEFSGELHQMVLGTDDNIYISANNNGTPQLRTLSVNPNTKVVTDLGLIGPVYPSDAGLKASAICSDNDYVYTVSQYNPYYLASKHKATGTLKTVITSSDKIYLTQTEFGCTAHAGQVYYMHNGDKLTEAQFTKALWNIPLDRQSDPDLFTSKANIQKAKEPDVVTKNAQVDVNQKADLWVNVNGEYQNFKYTLETYPQTIARLKRLENGNIFGTGRFSSGNFIFNTTTDELRTLGKAPGDNATFTQYNQKLYMSGYPSATTAEYDLNRDWTQYQHTWKPGTADVDPQTLNPRFIGFLRWDDNGVRVSGTHKAQCSALGADEMIYVAGQWYRDGNGGGLNWYDPKTGTYDGLYESLSNYAVTEMTTTHNGRYIILSTQGVVDTVFHKSTPSEGRIFVFDTQSKSMVNNFDPLPESIGAGQIIGTDGAYILGVGTNDAGNKVYTYRANVLTGHIDYKKSFDYASVYRTGGLYIGGSLIAKGPHNYIWTFMGGKLIKIDPLSGEIIVVGRLSKDGVENTSGQYGGLVFSGNTLYLSAETYLRRVSNIAQ